DRVDASRLARPGRAGDQGVGHLLQVGPDGAARDVLAEPGGQRRGALRPPAVDVTEADQAAALVRDLHSDGLLAGDRRQDPDVGRGERVGEVVLELRDLRDLRPGRQLELVAAHMGAADRADDLRLDPEVPERLEQVAGDLLVIALVRALVGRAALEHLVRDGRLVVDLLRLGDAAPLLAHGGERDGLLFSRVFHGFAINARVL